MNFLSLNKIFGQREKKLLKIIANHKKKLFLAMFFMIIVAGATAATAYIIKPMLDDIFINKDKTKLFFIPLVTILIFFLKGGGTYAQEYLMNYVGEEIIREFRNSLYEKIIDLPLSFFHEQKTGTLMSRITNDVNIVKSMVSIAVTSLLKDVFTVIGLIIVILYMDWKLAIGAFAILPMAFYPILIFGRRVRKYSTSYQEAMARLNIFLYETFSGIKILKTFTMEEFEKKRFYIKTHELFKFEMKSAIAKTLSSPVMEFLGGLGIAFVVWFGGSRVVAGISTPGTFFSFLTAVMMIYDPVKRLSRLNSTVQEGLAAINRIFDVVERETHIKELKKPILLKENSLKVEFKDVSFAYDLSEKFVLNNINFKVESGNIIAIVGVSGGGKTSLVNLIPRFYDISHGNIFIGDHNIKDIALTSLRQKISIVTQEPILFNETVTDNIRYGRIGASDEDVKIAAKAAYAHDFIEKFPKGYNTFVGELGNRLSGGEKQRLCIARALIKNAPILILDEATSSLDAESEKLVQKALVNLMKGRTTFVIAHRLSTIDHATQIIVLKNGKLIEKGTHNQLMKDKKEYFKLQNMQNVRKMDMKH
ncbi:MAG: ABC transporter permease [Desulfobacteraceae bacterium 4572_130]|nr:MAG: ABC transporter permease [Desulfobacteraceae bacterium 4572_130]